MSIEKALFDYLSNKSEITAFVSDRVYPDIGPEDAAYPFITITVVNENHDHHLEGASGFVNPFVQIDAWCETIDDQLKLAKAIRNSLDGYTGSMGTDSLAIRNCILTNRQSLRDNNTYGEGRPIFRSSLDFSIWHNDTVPTL